MKGKGVRVSAVACAGLFLALPAYADTEPLPEGGKQANIRIERDVVVISAHMGVAYLNGDATELVYDADTGRKISELQWGLDNVYMLNVGAAVSPLSWLTLSADFWINLNKGDGDMDDYDFLATNYSGYTHWSHHDDTDLEQGLMLDLNAAFTFYSFGETSFNGIVGYKYDNWEWESRGGTYTYSSYYLFDTVGSFPDGEKAISYNHWFHVPYVGLGFESSAGKVFFRGRVIASPLVSAEDEDIHHMRNLRFEEDFDTSSMYGVDLAIGYEVTPNFALTAAFKYQKYEEAKGETTITDLTTGQKYHYPGDAAGTDHTSSMISAGLEYRF